MRDRGPVARPVPAERGGTCRPPWIPRAPHPVVCTKVGDTPRRRSRRSARLAGIQIAPCMRSAWHEAPNDAAGPPTCTGVRGDSRARAARHSLAAGPSVRTGVASRAMRATYRLQLTRECPLRAACAVTGYLARLGVSHLYSSPILAARAGSTHGYDVIDPSRLAPTLGTERIWRSCARRSQPGGMGLLLDVVPNHQAATTDNPAWNDVLTHGRASRFASWFDIDWDGAASAAGRVLLPVLADPRGRCLARGEIRLACEDGRLRIRYGDASFPVEPRSMLQIVGNEPGPLHDLAARMRRLPGWRTTDPVLAARRVVAGDQILATILERHHTLRRVPRRARARRRGLRGSRGARAPGGAARCAALSPGALAARRRGPELPALLRDQRSDRRAGRGPARVRRHACAGARLGRRRHDLGASRRSHRRAARSRRVPRRARRRGGGCTPRGRQGPRSWSRRSSPPGKACAATGRSLAPPGTSS